MKMMHSVFFEHLQTGPDEKQTHLLENVAIANALQLEAARRRASPYLL